MNTTPPGHEPPEPDGTGEVPWPGPFPQVLPDGLPDCGPGPDAQVEARESISLAFVTALQLLPPRQRAVLILRDVLGFPVSEAADILNCTEEWVASALIRARATLRARLAACPEREPPPPPGSAAERDMVARFSRAFEADDVDDIVALLTEDVWLSIPPLALEYHGREVAARFLAAVRYGRHYRVVATRANGQPAFGVYVRDPSAPVAHANGLLVLTLAGHRIGVMTYFPASVFPRFGLPRTLPDP
jgi:RNA polymerase sigma-70 factor (TIGR02960 family)